MCDQKGADRGLWVRTRSVAYQGANRRTLCRLDNSIEVHHVVEIHNLHTYPLDIVVCRGDISQSTQRSIQFYSPKVSCTDIHWEDTIKPFFPDGEKTLSGVQLLSTQTSSGYDSVSVEVEGISSLWGARKVSLTITVWVV